MSPQEIFVIDFAVLNHKIFFIYTFCYDKHLSKQVFLYYCYFFNNLKNQKKLINDFSSILYMISVNYLRIELICNILHCLHTFYHKILQLDGDGLDKKR